MSKKNSKPSETKLRKTHLVGFETEMLILEENGAISSLADELIEKAEQAKLPYPVHKEYAHNMVEISSAPNVKLTKVAHGWLQSAKKLINIAKDLGLRLYPYGTYTGTHVPTTRTDRYYRMCEDILGPEKYTMSTGRVMGFHLHYTLPYGTFNQQNKSLKHLFNSRYKEQLLNLYNSAIAMDPAVSNFMESSPFVDGVFTANDSRLFLYRAMRTGTGSKMIRGLYYDYPMFGRLPRYKATISDLILLIERRHNTWKEMVEERHPEYIDIVESKHPLQFNWGPVRINRAGTIEYRGMDMNLPSNIIGTSLLIKYFLNKVRRDELIIRPSDIGIKEPFKIEDQIVHVPPYGYLSEVLQYKSALYGMQDDEVYRYTKNLTAIAMKEVPMKKDPSIDRLNKMLANRKTKSDEILEYVKKEGHIISEKLDETFAREFALRGCDELEIEVDQLLDSELAIDLEE
ncbi:Glutamate--cysteine ligase [Candidatus Bilamarchaeum dharawalense]|uniref:Glutamate--cysteine ligase n=1 Tax=Candidatus Bilamarchaeum dharawalense TaxID=2885759 RepID=A0A5E4LSG0_9ARCH|nr:Glutamate--cysteine ligase [Candidatus Bilamarchaeum dharawalense]